MDPLFIPQPDTIPVSWGWFQFLLLLTFPLHLLAMNAMLGGLAIGIVQHVKGGELQRQLAHRIAIALPLVIAFVVNLGVAPLLFVQVLYGQFLYSSSILMGVFWILIVPILIIAYYSAYLYDFRFTQLGSAGPWVAILAFTLLVGIGFFFANNMLLMASPEQFGAYFSHKSGTLLSFGQPEFWPRFLHMLCGALAVGGLFVALLGRFRSAANPDLAHHAEHVGLQVFLVLTVGNILLGTWYFFSLPGEVRLLFMGHHFGATSAFCVALLLAAGTLFGAWKKRFWLTFYHAVGLVVVMSFMRSWVRSGYLKDFFSLDALRVVPQYSPMIFFFVTLLVGIVCLGWLLKKTSGALLLERGRE
ncbi:hypothetical protein FCL47_13770 [Desulfopila sp. IMCC35006]|uniref:hypothetical protein n=1 Tax=Desulfopila sp. IMCC35006 TaxID=2569542 RepID=UPI0010AC0944|nr:hypothetical protein [Desulfopila sp. IMCC35006]TKB25598.1 hypothetical protein FCL47_13770 [Desulfopila sp. IMCC35006]